MSLLLEITMIYIEENIITKLQKLYSPPRNSRVGNKLPKLFVKKLSCMGDLLPVCKIFTERPANKLYDRETFLDFILIPSVIKKLFCFIKKFSKQTYQINFNLIVFPLKCGCLH